jgi:signal transduction histidine kinase
MLKQSKHSPLVRGVSLVVISGNCLAIAAIVALLSISYYFTQNTQALSSLLVCGAAFIYTVIAYIFLLRGYHYTVSYLLVSFYIALAGGITWSWGINTPIGLLIFGMVIVLAGILLSARHSLFAGCLAGGFLLASQIVVTLDWHHPDISWTGNHSNFGDVLAYCVTFGMLALASWLYNREMERTLMQARSAEAALRRQKATLEKRVQERTKDLRRLQLEEMRQMYRFAELGQQGVTLLHDLANHLTALTLEMEGLEKKQPKEIARAQQITQYLGNVVEVTRQRLNGETKDRPFDIVRQTSETINFLRYKATQNGVVIEWQPPKRPLRCIGDPASFSQIIGIITNNAIDAYSSAARSNNNRRVIVAIQQNRTYVAIHISDWGRGITNQQRKRLFTPHHSTKKSGLGLGLYIAKQTTEMQFSGKISLSDRIDYTEFIIRLPYLK